MNLGSSMTGKKIMKKFHKLAYLAVFSALIIPGCGGSDSGAPIDETPIDEVPIDETPLPMLPDAYLMFNPDSVTTVIDGANVIIETTGLPNHTSPYWSSDHPLYIDPIVTTLERLVPGNIDDFVGTYTLTVPGVPDKATTPSATGLGPIGIAVSGAPIYNDEEGAGRALDDAIGGLDYNGAHTGPSSYHYHLEPIAISDDDDNLVGVIADGFFLYGRKCNSTGTYPTDLDASGGHIGITQHSTEPVYHYHIQNDLFLNAYYILFPGDYQGTPNAVQ